MTKTAIWSALLLGITTISPAIAQDGSVDEKRVYVARDVCTGMAARFGSAPDGGTIEYQSGQFRVLKGRGTITIFEGAVKLTEIPGFNYSNYVDCVEKVIAGIERMKRPADSGKRLESFMAGYEIQDLLSVGTCLRPAAEGGFYIGDMDNQGRPLAQEAIEKLIVSLSKSVERRIRRVSQETISLELEDDLRFYRFYPDRPVPYFPEDAAQEKRNTVIEAIPSDFSDYANLGFLVGRMKRAYLYIWVFSGFIEDTRNRNDPRSIRAATYLPPTVACLRRGYAANRQDLRLLLVDLSLDNVRVPDDALALGGREDRSKYFDEQVTSKIRQALRANP